MPSSAHPHLSALESEPLNDGNRKALSLEVLIGSLCLPKEEEQIRVLVGLYVCVCARMHV